MKIHADVINEIINIDFLKEERETNIPITQLKTVKEAEKNINSLKWENFVLDKRGDFTVYLFKNHGDIYKHWNELVDSVKEEIIPQIKESLDNLIAEGQPESTFFDDLYALYQAGYIPCGFAKGCYKVL